MRRGGTAPAVMNAANEIAVEAFLNKRIGFLDISRTVRETLDRAEGNGLLTKARTLADVLEVDGERGLWRELPSNGAAHLSWPGWEAADTSLSDLLALCIGMRDCALGTGA